MGAARFSHTFCATVARLELGRPTTTAALIAAGLAGALLLARSATTPTIALIVTGVPPCVFFHLAANLADDGASGYLRYLAVTRGRGLPALRTLIVAMTAASVVIGALLVASEVVTPAILSAVVAMCVLNASIASLIAVWVRRSAPALFAYATWVVVNWLAAWATLNGASTAQEASRTLAGMPGAVATMIGSAPAAATNSVIFLVAFALLAAACVVSTVTPRSANYRTWSKRAAMSLILLAIALGLTMASGSSMTVIV